MARGIATIRIRRMSAPSRAGVEDEYMHRSRNTEMLNVVGFTTFAMNQKTYFSQVFRKKSLPLDMSKKLKPPNYFIQYNFKTIQV